VNHRVLRILFFALSGIEALAGVILLFATSWVLSLPPASLPLDLAHSGYVLLLLKAIGIIAIALAYLFCVVARDPVRYVAVIDMLVFILVAVAILNLYAVATLRSGLFYPVSYLIARAVVQLILAVIFVVLRPKPERTAA
jgi:hypothetical protein